MQIKLSMRESRPQPSNSPYIGGGQDDKYRFTIITDGLIRFEWAPDGVFEDRPSAFAANRKQEEYPEYRLKQTANEIEIFTNRFHLTYNKQEFSADGLSVRVYDYDRTVWRYGEERQTLGGTYRTLDGVDGRVGLGPGVASKDGFAHIDDSNTMLFTEDGFIAPRRPGPGRVDGYLFCYGHEYGESVKALYKISGPQPLLPRWALGNWWSRYYEYSAESYLELMDKFEENRVPLTVGVIDMDWHLVDDPRVKKARSTGWTGYTWNKKLFPDPPEFIKRLHERKLKVTLNEHPADGVYSFEDVYQEVAKALNFDTSHKDAIAFEITDRKFMRAYFDIILHSIEKDGVDFWWIDWQQGEHSQMPGVDPLWVLNHFHFLHNKKLQETRKLKDSGSSFPMIFSRYAGPGSHRYPIGFSGDTVTTWESLQFQPEFTATASNIGYAQWSHDIGGHMLGYRDDDLTSRWVQLGVFSPIMRLHSTKSRWVCKEPWNLAAGSGQGPRDVVTNFLRLRHRLIPYLFTMNYLASTRGIPLVQPIYWKYPERDEAYEVPNQYFFGTEMMVAPVTSPQNKNTKTGRVLCWLPPGTWVDFFTGVVYDGERKTWLNRTLDKAPVLLRKGSIVPLDIATEPDNGAANPEGFEIVVVVGDDGHFMVIEELEGKEQGWVKTPIHFDQANGVLDIGPARGGPSTKRPITIRFLGYKPTTSDVRVNDQAYTLANVDNGSLLHIGLVQSDVKTSVSVGKSPQLAVNDPESLIFPLVYDAQFDFKLKDQIDEIITRKEIPLTSRTSQLEALKMGDELRILILEYLLADSRSR